MTPIRDDGEPMSDGRRDRRAAERRALGNALFASVLFAGVVVVSGVLFILLLELARLLD